MNIRAEELFQDQAFAYRLVSMTAEEAKNAIDNEGGEITLEELHDIAVGYNEIVNEINSNNGEIPAEVLENVVGGSWKGAKKGAIFGLIGGYMAGGYRGAIAGAVGGFVVGLLFW